MKARSLKIEEAGDFAEGKVYPKIRLMGRWLAQAGFQPGHRVEVLLVEPGVLSIRFRATSAVSAQ